MKRNDSTPCTVEGIWMGCEIDKPYSTDLPDRKGIMHHYEGTTTTVFVKAKTTGIYSTLIPIKVTSLDVKKQLPKLEEQNKGKNVFFLCELSYGFGKYSLDLLGLE